VRIGDALKLGVGLRNSAAAPFFVDRSGGYGESALNIVARKGGCEYQVTPLSFDRPLEEIKYFYVPLLPGDELRFTLDYLNVPGAGLVLPLPHPGEYEVAATLRSETSSDAPVAPIWQGFSESPGVAIHFEPARGGTIDRWIAKLERCVAQSAECPLAEIADFFLMVRIEGSARRAAVRLLRELIRSGEVEGLMLVPALTTQGGPADVAFLKSLEQEWRADRFVASVLRDLVARFAERLRDPCWARGAE
jgi:hypothetical protein